jgi:hypothetical protein
MCELLTFLLFSYTFVPPILSISQTLKLSNSQKSKTHRRGLHDSITHPLAKGGSREIMPAFLDQRDSQIYGKTIRKANGCEFPAPLKFLLATDSPNF